MRPPAAVRWLLLAPLLAASLARAQDPAAVREPESPLTWTITSASQYCFEGFDYSAGRAVIQPQGSASWRALEAGFWANGDARGPGLNEIDLSLQADWERGRWTGDLGWQHLRYPHRDWSATHEVFVDVALDAPFQPSLSVHTDVRAGDGSYVTFGLAHDLKTGAGVLGLATKLYVHDHYYGLTGVPALETSAGFGVPLAGLTLEPALSRFWTWENGDFRGEQALAAAWVFRVTVGTPK